MNRRVLILLAAGGSAGLLLAALAFEHLGGLAPCALCIWQRWPHLAAVAVGAVALAVPLAGLPLLGAGAALTSAGIGAYHTGVERQWWQGPQACAGAGDIGALTPEELMAQILAAPVIRCDEVPWELLGLSMASWNMLASLALAGVWLWAFRARRSPA